MEKKLIHFNNTIKFEKNKKKDLLLRKYDKKVSYLDKKITGLSYDFFITNRQINHLNKINGRLISYIKKEQKKDTILSGLMKELRLLNQEIYTKNLCIKASLHSYRTLKRKCLMKLYQCINIIPC